MTEFYARNEYPNFTGTGPLSISFDYIDPEHIFCEVDGEQVPFSWLSSNTVELDDSVQNAFVMVRRITPVQNRIVDFENATILTENDLDTSALQVFHVAQEAIDLTHDIVALTSDRSIDMEGRYIYNLAAGVDAGDAVNKEQLDAKDLLFQQYLSEIRDKYDTINTWYDTVEDDTAYVANVKGAIDTIHGNMQSIETDLLAIQSDVTSKKQDTVNAATQAAADKQTIAGYKSDIEQIKDDADALGSQVSTDRSAVASDRQHIDQQVDTAEGYKDDANSAKTDAESAKSAAEAAESRVATMEQNVSQMQSALTNDPIPLGEWSSTSTPPTPDDTSKSWFYHVTIDGDIGSDTYNAGDEIYWSIDEQAWYRVPRGARVRSINGQDGDVDLSLTDLGGLSSSENSILSALLTVGDGGVIKLGNTRYLQAEDSSGAAHAILGILQTDTVLVGKTSLRLALRGSAIDLQDGTGTYTVWHSGNGGAGSELDAGKLGGKASTSYALLSGAAFTGDVSVDGKLSTVGSNNIEGYDVAARNNLSTVAGSVYAGSDNKHVLQGNDTWLRLNPSGDFSSGIYCGSSLLRTDGALQVGSSGSTFNCDSNSFTYKNSDIWHAGNFTPSNYLGKSSTAADSSKLGGLSLWSSGNNYDVVVWTSSFGVTHVGRYLDFHSGGDSETDAYDWRMYISSTNANSSMYFLNDGGSRRFEFLDGGEFRADGNVIGYYSDERLKDVIGGVEGLSAIRKWKPISYYGSKLGERLSRGAIKADRLEVGLSAQSVLETTPELIHPAPFDWNSEEQKSISGKGYMTLDYQRAVAVLVSAVQELDKQVQELIRPWYVKAWQWVKRWVK
ncbi:phage tail fiber domain-containing protein [Microbulbifer sp. ZKSA002]|uniref:phage tail fiber domain-containing protein n=1 Tax=Microbulbifer sp. ZKSA002 TaxID=3243388 RepID=UPI00403965D7